MASSAQDLQYSRDGAVYGSLAYDLDHEVLEYDLRHAGEEPGRRQKPAEQPKVRSVSKLGVREKQKVSRLAVAGFCAVAVMAVLVLLSYVHLTALSTEVVQLKRELNTLETENITLTAQYEQMFDLATVKEAAEAAGMTKPSGSQVYYIDLSGGDSAVVYQQSEPSVLTRILTSLHHGVYAVVEYFD